MSFIRSFIFIAAAFALFAAMPAEAGSKKCKGCITTVTMENGKKITTVYKPVGTRKVGMVGRHPYGVNTKGEVTGGKYYTQAGVPFYTDPTNTLVVTPNRITN